MCISLSPSLSLYIHIYSYIYSLYTYSTCRETIYICVYVYVERERERDTHIYLYRERDTHIHIERDTHIYVYICILERFLHKTATFHMNNLSWAKASTGNFLSLHTPSHLPSTISCFKNWNSVWISGRQTVSVSLSSYTKQIKEADLHPVSPQAI